MEPTKKYIGPKSIGSIVVEDFKSYDGGDVYTVLYDDGNKETMSKKTYDLAVTEEESDYTSVRNKKFAGIYKEIYVIIAEYLMGVAQNADKETIRREFLIKSLSVLTDFGLKNAEAEVLLNNLLAEMQGSVNALANELDNTFSRAANFLWTGSDDSFVPGTDIMMDRTLIDAKKIIDLIPVKKDESEEASA